MGKIEKYVDELLIFMVDKIDKNASILTMEEFNFSFKDDLKKVEEGEDLKNLKIIIKEKDDKLIEQVLMKASNEKLIEKTVFCGSKFNKIKLTPKGLDKSKDIKLNKEETKNKWASYISEKLLFPIIVSIITVIVASYFNNKNFNKELENLKKDIEWIKQNK